MGKKPLMGSEDEEIIRASYSESTAWIQSPEFVEMILHDSVFILEFMLKSNTQRSGDPLMDEPCLKNAVTEDLMLLENQLPYFILEKLFDAIAPRLHPKLTFRKLIIEHFRFEERKIRNNSKFRHFTDLMRCVRVETLPEQGEREEFKPIKHMHNAKKLDRGGVKFKAVEDEFSLEVRFVNGCLKIPRFWVDDGSEMMLRNVMALEQCHFPYEAHVCNHIMFLDFLIDTEKDVGVLVEKGIIWNCLGKPGSVAEMVNKLGLGIIDAGSYYSVIADNVQTHYSNRITKSRAVLKRVYFGDLWSGTATVAATFLLLMTLIQTVSSIIQVMHRDKPRCL